MTPGMMMRLCCCVSCLWMRVAIRNVIAFPFRGLPSSVHLRLYAFRIAVAYPCPPDVEDQAVNGVGWMYCGESDEEAMALGGAGAGAFMNAAAHLVGVGSIYPSPAYSLQASAIQLRDRPGDVINPLQQGTPIGNPDTVIAALRQWEAIGVDRMVFLINFDQVVPHEVMPAFEEPERPSLTTLPDFGAVEEIGLLAAAGGGGD